MAAKRPAITLPAALVGGAVMLTGCADAFYETASLSRLRGPELAMPTEITPPVRVQAIRGTPDQWDMNERLAAALRDRDIPASVGAASRASYVLKGRARPVGEDGTRVKLIWELFDSNGKRVSEIEQLAAMPDDSWLRVGAATLDSVAAAAADSIAPIVPSASLGDAQFASISRSQEPAPPVDARMAIRRQMHEGHAGPLHRRLVGLAGVGGDAVRRQRFAYSPSRAARVALDADPRRLLGRLASAAAPRPDRDNPPAAQTADAQSAPAARIEHGQLPAPPSAKLVPPEIEPQPIPDLPAMRRLPLDFTIQELGRLAARAQPSKTAPERIESEAFTEAWTPAVRAAGLDYIAPQAGAIASTAFWAQLGAFRQKPVAEDWYDQIQRRNRHILEGLPHRIVRANLGRGKGVYYRVRLGPFPSNAEARGTCRSLAGAGVDCMVWRSG